MWKMERCVEQHIHGPNPPAPACLPPSPSQTTLEEEGLPWLSPYFWSAILSFVPSGIVPGSPLPSAALFFGDFLESLNSDPAVCFSPLVHSAWWTPPAPSLRFFAGSGPSQCFGRGSDSKGHSNPFCGTGCCVTLSDPGTGSFHGTSWSRIGAQ